MHATVVRPLHWHCPTCGHCAEAHKLVEAFDPRDDLTLMCTGCTTPPRYRCPADAFGHTRTDTLASMFAQSMHDGLSEAGI